MAEIRDIPADVKALRKGDWIAYPTKDTLFGKWEIRVAQIVYVSNSYVCTGYLYGHQSRNDDVKFEDIIAIGSKSGKEKIKLYSGYYGFHILKPDNQHFINWQEEYKDR